MDNILEEVIKERIKSGKIKTVSIDELDAMDNCDNVKVSRKQFLSIMSETYSRTAKVVTCKLFKVILYTTRYIIHYIHNVIKNSRK